MGSNPFRMIKLLVSLPAVRALGIAKEDSDLPRVHVEWFAERDGVRSTE